MKIRLNQIDFDVKPVEGHLRDVLLSDGVIRQAVVRNVWSWDHAAQEGKTLARMTPQQGVPLPNGMSFFVPKTGSNGTIVQSDGPSRAMAKRFVECVKGRNVSDVLNALQNILMIQQTAIPHRNFDGLRPVASYTIKMRTEHDVVQLREAGRNLSAYLFVPGQVSFQHSITETAEGYESLIKAHPELAAPQPAFVVPARSDANRAVRMIAIAQRVQELQARALELNGAGEEINDPSLRQALGRAVAEWKAIIPKPKQPESAQA